jgi:hypothetical protein
MLILLKLYYDKHYFKYLKKYVIYKNIFTFKVPIHKVY